MLFLSYLCKVHLSINTWFLFIMKSKISDINQIILKCRNIFWNNMYNWGENHKIKGIWHVSCLTKNIFFKTVFDSVDNCCILI